MSIHDKYWRLVNQVIESSNVILYVADARFPTLSRHKKLERRLLDDPDTGFVLTLNKQDLVPQTVVRKWARLINKEGIPTVYTSASDRMGTSIVRRRIMMAAPSKPVNLGIIGMPNTGKSSLINVFRGSHSAPTSPVPGHTKSRQMIRTSAKVMVHDTPGVVDKFLCEADQLVMGTLRVEAIKDPLESAIILAERLDEINSEVFREGLPVPYEDGEQLVEAYAAFRNKLVKGGLPDVQMGARLFLQDFIHGKLPMWEPCPVE